MVYDLLDKQEVSGEVISDEEIMLTNSTHARRVTAWVEVDGKRRQMTFLTNHLKWSAVTACDKSLFQASFSTVYRVLKEQNLMTARGPGGAHNGNSKAPFRKDLTGPNQRWCWDISYLLLDEYSRKAIQWRISWQQTAEESRLLLEGGLIEQNILDLPEDQRPRAPDESQTDSEAV